MHYLQAIAQGKHFFTFNFKLTSCREYCTCYSASVYSRSRAICAIPYCHTIPLPSVSSYSMTVIHRHTGKQCYSSYSIASTPYIKCRPLSCNTILYDYEALESRIPSLGVKYVISPLSQLIESWSINCITSDSVGEGATI